VRRRVRRGTCCRRPFGGWAVAAGLPSGPSCCGGVRLATGRELDPIRADDRRRERNRRFAAAPRAVANPSGVGAGSRLSRRRRLDALPVLPRLGDCRRRRSLGRGSLGLDGRPRRGGRDVGGRRRDGLDGRLWPRRRRPGDGSRRQERQWVDIALILAREPQSEIDERLGEVDHAARADGPDDPALGHARPAPDADRPEVHERRGVPERRLDRDGLPAGRHRAGECDDAFGGRKHVGSGRRPEVDAAVLPGRVRVRTVEGEGTEQRPVDGPGPGLRCGWGQDERAERDDSDSPDHEASLLPGLRTERPYQGRALVVNTGYKVRR
jgi:hypothetical protein